MPLDSVGLFAIMHNTTVLLVLGPHSVLAFADRVPSHSSQTARDLSGRGQHTHAWAWKYSKRALSEEILYKFRTPFKIKPRLVRTCTKYYQKTLISSISVPRHVYVPMHQKVTHCAAQMPGHPAQKRSHAVWPKRKKHRTVTHKCTSRTLSGG